MWVHYIWPSGFSTQSVLAALHRMLKLLGIPGAQLATFKSFRAGHATQLAAQGCSLETILEAGSWRSNAFAKYVGADLADKMQVLRLALAADDDEWAGLICQTFHPHFPCVAASRRPDKMK